MILVKTEVTVFSQSEEYFSEDEDDFIVDGEKLKYNKTPKLLCITLD